MIESASLRVVLTQDTVVTVAARDGLDLVMAAAAAAVVVLFLAIAVVLTILLLQFRRAVRKVDEVRRRVSVDPAMHSLRKTAVNVEAISDHLRTETDKLSRAVSGVSEGLSRASERMEERIEEFNALMEVVQSEAEGTFVDGAATARGVRAGLGRLGRRRRPPLRDRGGPSGDPPRPTDGPSRRGDPAEAPPRDEESARGEARGAE